MPSFTQISFALGFPLGVLLILALVFRRNNPRANRLLVGVVLCELFVQLNSYLHQTGLIEQVPWLMRANFPTNLAGGALLYLYVCCLTVPGFRLEKKHVRLFIPAVFGFLWYLGIALFFRDHPLWAHSDEYFRERAFRQVVGQVVFFFFLVKSIRAVHTYETRIKDYFSEIEKVRLNWLKTLLAGTMGLLAIGVADVLMGPGVTLWHIGVPFLTLQTYAFVLFALRQSPVFLSVPEEKRPENGATVPLLSPDALQKETARLKAYMESAKPYLNPDLRLNDLAQATNLKTYLLSEVINRGMKLNFFDFVNRYRVEEVKVRLLDPKWAHMSILGISSECGFNSKSSFNEAFKKHANTTPSAFRNQPRDNA